MMPTLAHLCVEPNSGYSFLDYLVMFATVNRRAENLRVRERTQLHFYGGRMLALTDMDSFLAVDTDGR